MIGTAGSACAECHEYKDFMEMVLIALMIAGLAPILLAFWANRRTSLAHALLWAALAWLTWAAAYLLEWLHEGTLPPARTGALCLTGCSSIAVLGARRPIVFAWNFVVLGLLVVMLLPLVEKAIIGTDSFDSLRTVFMAGTIVVGLLNYLPTRMGPPALLLMVVCLGQLFAAPHSFVTFDLLLAVVPWLAWLCVRRGAAGSEFDGLWLSFRDRWGMVWSQRVREQFNNAAQNVRWPVTLSWFGLVGRENVDDEARYVEMLGKILQRFLPEGDWR